MTEQTNHQIQLIIAKIIEFQESVERDRQNLNEEIQFNLKDLYVAVCARSSQVSFKDLFKFIGKEIQEKVEANSIESFIKFHNENSSLNLTFIEFSSIFLSKQNKLLAKMVLEREDLGAITNYLLEICKKIISQELELHQYILKTKKLWIQSILDDERNLSEAKLSQYFRENELTFNQQQIILFLRYFQFFSNQIINASKLYQILAYPSSNLLQTYLTRNTTKNKCLESTFLPPKSPKSVRSEYFDCLQRTKPTQTTNYRQIQSIQKHVVRSLSPVRFQIFKKKQMYNWQNSINKLLTCIKDIIWMEKELQYNRIQLALCTDFYPILFFEGFNKDKQKRLLPSILHQYLKQFGILTEIQDIYLLFKRYGKNGKMDFGDFCDLFEVCQRAYSLIQKNRNVSSLQDITIQTKKCFLLNILSAIKIESNVMKRKKELSLEKINFSLILGSLCQNQSKQISPRSLQEAFSEYTVFNISKQQMDLFFWRFTSKNNEPLMHSTLIQFFENVQQSKRK